MSTPFTVPTIDISPYSGDGSADERAAVAAAVDHACRTVGFMQIVGHGVRDDVIDGLVAAIDGFFGLGLDDKKAYMRPKSENRGYTPPKSETLSYTLGIDPASRMNDFFEAFNVGVTPGDFPGGGPATAAYPGDVWPEEVPGFRIAVEAYFAEAQRVARTLTRIFEDALDVPSGSFDPFVRNSLDVLRMNNYALPPASVELGAEMTGMGEHTDFGLVTVLWADQVAGLQVLDADGGWNDVQPADDAFLVNIGDVMARLTNDQWSSTLHRVKPPIVDGTIRRRRSAAYFEDGNPAAVVAPLPGFVPEGGVAHYAAVTLQEHVEAKLAGLKLIKKNEGAHREAARLTGSGNA
ncbi:MAG: 2-oxoglutarate and iron-dependent oxygenase domain-containing protein [Microbacterium sp.]|uniref:isopenicillin N synthase family dioxygenase n=1 Tax=Microbacterium sp. TaxID=51671 RepID=UPI0039E60E75